MVNTTVAGRGTFRFEIIWGSIGSAPVASITHPRASTRDAYILIDKISHPKKFKVFKKLAPELQNRIWELAIDDVEDRVITVVKYTSDPVLDGDLCYLPRVRAICNVPALLRTCKDSRSLAQKYYDKALHAGLRNNGYVYINFRKDTLYLPDQQCISKLFNWYQPTNDSDPKAEQVRRHSVQYMHKLWKPKHSISSCVRPDYPTTRDQLYENLRYLITSHRFWLDDELIDLGKFLSVEKVIYLPNTHVPNTPLDVWKGIKKNFIKERFTPTEIKDLGGVDKIETSDFKLKKENVCIMTEKEVKKETNFPKRKNAKLRGADPLKHN